MKGRAASPIRTGQFIKKHLEDHEPACITDMHRALKAVISKENEDRKMDGTTLYRPPTYENFGKYLRNLVTLGLVEFSGEERDMELPPSDPNPLLSIRMVGGKPRAVESKRRYFQLTERGRGEPLDGAWANPIKALGYSNPKSMV